MMTTISWSTEMGRRKPRAMAWGSLFVFALSGALTCSPAPAAWRYCWRSFVLHPCRPTWRPSVGRAHPRNRRKRVVGRCDFAHCGRGAEGADNAKPPLPESDQGRAELSGNRGPKAAFRAVAFTLILRMARGWGDESSRLWRSRLRRCGADDQRAGSAAHRKALHGADPR
jgi:hypothetical protein